MANFILMVPVEIDIDEGGSARDVWTSIKAHGAFPAVIASFYSWTARFDRVLLRDVEAAYRDGLGKDG